jgi:hypothetical protein
MPASAPLRRLRLLPSFAAAAVLVVAGCGDGGTQQEDATTTSSSSTAPVLGADEEQVRLIERAPETVTDSESEWTLEVTAFENTDDPVVMLDVHHDEAAGRTHELTLGDTVDFAGESWRLSEIAISDASEQPGSATLVRQD